MALGKETDAELAKAFQDLRELKVDVAYPFLLELYQDYRQGVLSSEDFVQAVRLVESYVFRRAVCAIPTNSLNKTFATFGRVLNKNKYLESIEAHFLLLPSYRRFPNDEEFQRELQVRDLYNFRSRSYWLRRVENYDRRERVVVDEYTIEHIMPQNPNLSNRWKETLGPDWKRVQEAWLHTLGNLTLTGYNAEYSDRPFEEKRDMSGGFAVSPLKLNEGLGTLERWDEAAIKERALRLAEKATKVWPAPSLSSEVVSIYRPTEERVAVYTIGDHQMLSEGSAARPLFDALRKEILALDPCVYEEFLKLYVAYKAETNFVDVIPHKNWLQLALNMRFHELNDPKEIARDITNLGRWGNGDVEVHLRRIDDLPYTMGLIRQSLEKQMGNSDEPQ